MFSKLSVALLTMFLICSDDDMHVSAPGLATGEECSIPHASIL